MNRQVTRVPESEYDGPVYVGEQYFNDLDDFREHWYSEHGEDAPITDDVWACDVFPVTVMSALDLCEHAADDSYDGCYDDLRLHPAFAALDEAIRAFNAAHGCRNYDVDYSRLIVLEAAAAQLQEPHS